MLLWEGGGGRALGFEGWCLIFDFVMCSKGALVGCSVWVAIWVEGAEAAGAVAYVRRAGAAVRLTKVRAKEQLGQAIVVCVR